MLHFSERINDDDDDDDDDTVCIVRSALIDLPSGAPCDEINELRYCARSLVCLRCPDDDQYKFGKILWPF